MANQWLRLWHDLPTDPKWRTISKISKQRIGDVIAVYIHMLVTASNAVKRGYIEHWCDEDVSSLLDMDIEAVIAIRTAMQGRVLNGEYLTGWEKRQPAREDNSSSRVRAYRDKKKQNETHCNADETHCNAAASNVTLDKDTDKEKDIEKKESKRVALRFALTELPFEWKSWAIQEKGWDESVIADVWGMFREYWTTGKGKTTKRADWSMSWRTWCRKEKFHQPNPQGESYGRPKTKYERTVEAFQRAAAEREQGSNQET